MGDTLLRIEHLAARAHAGQKRKFENAPYIVHLVRVMKLCGEYTTSKHVLAAALLHDVLEDTSMKKGELEEAVRQIMSPACASLAIKLVLELTDVYVKASYPHLNRRQRKQKEAERLGGCSGEAQTIKYADILDNAATLAEADPSFAMVYCQEALQLLKKMDKGNAALRQKAVTFVEQYVLTLSPS